MIKSTPFKDPAAERTLIATILRHGKDALVDSQAFVGSKDFAVPINRAIYTCLEELNEDPSCQTFDLEALRLKADQLGLSKYMEGSKENEYLELLKEANESLDNLPMFGLKVKKHSVIRELYERYQDAQNYLSNLKGDEDLSDVLSKAESSVIDYVSGKGGSERLENIASDLVDDVIYKIENDPVDQIGLPTGFNKYDKAIGGGLRRSAIAMMAARSKVGKGFMGANIALNIAKRGVPVLYLDTEMTKKIQSARLISIEADCPLEKYETGKFKLDKKLCDRVLHSAHKLNELPFTYKEIAGMSHIEALSLARRWLVSQVGFNSEGKANDCVIVYDYIKLTSPEQIGKNIAEHAALGFLMTDLNTFGVKYDVPILAFAQLNRDGIDGNDGSVIALSDRILWLCSSMSFIRNKAEEDEETCGFEYGNKKLTILDTRYGAGLPTDYDYINLNASLRPRVSDLVATGKISEGPLFSEVTGR